MTSNGVLNIHQSSPAAMLRATLMFGISIRILKVLLLTRRRLSQLVVRELTKTMMIQRLSVASNSQEMAGELLLEIQMVLSVFG